MQVLRFPERGQGLLLQQVQRQGGEQAVRDRAQRLRDALRWEV